MRRLTTVIVLATSALSFGQSWEKLVAPGLTYRMEIDSKTPRVIHALRWSFTAPSLFARSEVSQMRLYGAPGAEAKETTSSIVKKSKAIAGINGDFFPASGEPLGTMVRDGQLLSRPYPGRPAFAWGPSSQAFVTLDWQGDVSFDSGQPRQLQGINEDLQDDRLVLYTDGAAEVRSNGPSTYLVLEMDNPQAAPNSVNRGWVTEVLRGQTSYKIKKGQYVIAMQGPGSASLTNTTVGTAVRITMRTSGLDWASFDNAIGGGPSLLRGGKFVDDGAAGNFGKTFLENRHPRTAIGRTPQGDIWLVTVDGRQPMSAGCSIREIADLMLTFGCTDAINLDGGGSTTLSLFGEVLNRPSDGTERRISNALLIFGPTYSSPGETVTIEGAANLTGTANAPYRLLGADGNAIPNREVLWSAMGPGGWIDQSGTFRPLPAGGTATIRAFSRGSVASINVKVATTQPAQPANEGSEPNR